MTEELKRHIVAIARECEADLQLAALNRARGFDEAAANHEAAAAAWSRCAFLAAQS